MKTPRHAVLAGIAALALLGGASFASAQEPSQKSTGAPQSTQPQAKQPQAKEPMKMNQPPAAGQRTGKNTTEQKPSQQSAEMNKTNKAVAGNKQAARTEHTRQSAMTRSKKATGRRTAERARMSRKSRSAEMRTRNHGQGTAAQERNGQRIATQQGQGPQQGQGMKGLQGNASGMNVQLNDQQRTQIRDTVLNARGAPRIGNVNFDVTVGVMVPRASIHVLPVPETLVRIEPMWRGLRYFVFQNEVVIVNPRDMRIVAVVMV